MIAFEAKHTDSDRITYYATTEAQNEALEAYHNIGRDDVHRMVYHVYETCRHCGYQIDTPGTSSIVAHLREPGSNYCLLCGYQFSN